MLKARIITALILLPIVVAGIIYLPTIYIKICSAFVLGLAIYEWLTLIFGKDVLRYLYYAALALVVAIIYLLKINIFYVYLSSVIWWLIAFVAVCYYPRNESFWRKTYVQLVSGGLVFIPVWFAIGDLHATTYGPQLVLFGCSIIWGADIGAYFFGRAFGKQKLAPNVSPGKTLAGLYGAIVFAVILSLIFYYLMKPELNVIHLVWLSLLTMLFAVVGDLHESMSKRILGAKDSGSILPGHGGVYDRIDSMLAAFPTYVLGLQILNNLRIMSV